MEWIDKYDGLCPGCGETPSKPEETGRWAATDTDWVHENKSGNPEPCKGG